MLSIDGYCKGDDIDECDDDGDEGDGNEGYGDSVGMVMIMLRVMIMGNGK